MTHKFGCVPWNKSPRRSINAGSMLLDTSPLQSVEPRAIQSSWATSPRRVRKRPPTAQKLWQNWYETLLSRENKGSMAIAVLVPQRVRAEAGELAEHVADWLHERGHSARISES